MALLNMGSLLVAYYTIAPISLDLLRPALLSETKKRGVVRLARFELATDGLWWRRQDSNLHSRFLPIELLPQRPLLYLLSYSPRSFIWLYGPETSKRTDTILAASSQQ